MVVHAWGPLTILHALTESCPRLVCWGVRGQMWMETAAHGTPQCEVRRSENEKNEAEGSRWETVREAPQQADLGGHHPSDVEVAEERPGEWAEQAVMRWRVLRVGQQAAIRNFHFFFFPFGSGKPE